MGPDEGNKEISFNEIAYRSFDNANKKGFYDKINELLRHPALTLEQKLFIKQIWLNSRLMLIVSELAEAMEGIRDQNFDITPKSGGLGEELADAAIRLADLFFHVNIDANNAIKIKMDYNKTRPHMHNRTL